LLVDERRGHSFLSSVSFCSFRCSLILSGVTVTMSSWADETEDSREEEQAPKWKGWNIPPRPAVNAEPVWPEENKPKKDERKGHDDDRGRPDYDRKYDAPRDRGYRDGPRDRGDRERDRGDRYDRDGPRDPGDRGDRYDRDRERDRGRDRGEREHHREPVPLPTQPPYTAYLGNLDFDVREEDIGNFFEYAGCKVRSVRLVSFQNGRPKGFGYVVFDDLESLKLALKQDGTELLNRQVRVDVAEERPEGRRRGGDRDRERGSWGRGDDRGDRYPPRHGSGDRDFPDRRDRFERDRDNDNEPRERPKLELKPRTLPLDRSPSQSPSPSPAGVESPDSAKAADKAKPKVDPFGGARPRDEFEWLKKKEQKDEPKKEEKKEPAPERKQDEPRPARQSVRPEDRDKKERDFKPREGREYREPRDRPGPRQGPRDKDREREKEREGAWSHGGNKGSTQKGSARQSSFQDKPRDRDREKDREREREKDSASASTNVNKQETREKRADSKSKEEPKKQSKPAEDPTSNRFAALSLIEDEVECP
jgi:translation initiation factor 4B